VVISVPFPLRFIGERDGRLRDREWASGGSEPVRIVTRKKIQ
jgi:hypothetical protein